MLNTREFAHASLRCLRCRVLQKTESKRRQMTAAKEVWVTSASSCTIRGRAPHRDSRASSASSTDRAPPAVWTCG